MRRTKILRSLKTLAGLAVAAAAVPFIAGAQVSGGGSYTVNNPLNATSFPDFINKVLQGILIIAVPIIVLFIVYSGFLFVTARGDTHQLERARTNFLYVMIGAAVLLGASALAAIIANTLKSFGVGA